MNVRKAGWKIVAVGVVLVAVYWLGLRSDPAVERLNEAIRREGSEDLRRFPYVFRVERVEGETAVLGTPRSSEVPVVRMIGAIHPELAGKSPDSPDFQTAQKELARVQGEAREIVARQPGVRRVKWELDRNWLIEHNIAPP